MKPVKVIGGGLAGCEAAWQIARRGIPVAIYEMRPGKTTPAHRTASLSELICSNSLKSTFTDKAHGLLKAELRLAGSLLLDAAESCSLPGGTALVVNREAFAETVTSRIEKHPLIEIVREEVRELSGGEMTVLAAGPLMSDTLAREVEYTLGAGSLAFYDAIAPTVDGAGINWRKVFRQDRYGDPGSGAYVNCPFQESDYMNFLGALGAGKTVPPRHFEDEKVFEACMPIEVIASRGTMSLAFGPMRPVGLTDPATGKRPFAVLQLRPENAENTLFSMVGFQTKLTHPEQERIFRMIPGLENVSFERLGSVHRNTYVNSPEVLDELQRARSAEWLHFAGQLCGVEGYTESMASGLMAGIYAAMAILGAEPEPPPPTTMTGALLKHITIQSDAGFQPVNAQFGLLQPPSPPVKNRKKRRELLSSRALSDMAGFLENIPSGL